MSGLKWSVRSPENHESGVAAIMAASDGTVCVPGPGGVLLDAERPAGIASFATHAVCVSWFCGRDVQRIGLSATVGNSEDILRWSPVTGSSKRPVAGHRAGAAPGDVSATD
jgi:hypothetical protein